MSHRPYFPSIEVRNTRSGFFEEAELQAVLEQLPADLRVLIEFVHLTGWRIGEAKGLTWRHVDFDAGTVRLEPGTTKNDEGRTFPFAALPRLEELLRAQREHTSALERAGGGSSRGCSTGAGDRSGTSTWRGDAPASAQVCPGDWSTTCGARRCGTSSGRGSRARWR